MGIGRLEYLDELIVSSLQQGEDISLYPHYLALPFLIEMARMECWDYVTIGHYGKISFKQGEDIHCILTLWPSPS